MILAKVYLMSLKVGCAFVAVDNTLQENLRFCSENSLRLWDLNWQ